MISNKSIKGLTNIRTKKSRIGMKKCMGNCYILFTMKKGLLAISDKLDLELHLALFLSIWQLEEDRLRKLIVATKSYRKGSWLLNATFQTKMISKSM